MPKIERLLYRSKVPPHFKGFRLLVRAIELQLEHPEYAENAWTKLYPALAQEFMTTPQNVERNIRHAIARSERRGIFGEPHRTNAHFIAECALKTRVE